jgi:(3S)-malyl-CoA thioesterase
MLAALPRAGARQRALMTLAARQQQQQQRQQHQRRALHSVLFCPGNKARVLQKALALQADAVIADFEDAVADSEKANARSTTAQVLRERRRQSSWPSSVATTASSSVSTTGTTYTAPPGGSGPFVAVRINEPALELGQADLSFLVDEWHAAQRAAAGAAAAPGNGGGDSASASFLCDALVLPKCESPEEIRHVVHRTDGCVPIWCMIETPRGVLEAARIAEVPQVQALLLGANDLTKCVQGRQTPTREPLFYAMSACVMAARAHGKMVFDSVHNDITDSEGLRHMCVQARDFGFSGKSLIHPDQVREDQRRRRQGRR